MATVLLRARLEAPKMVGAPKSQVSLQRLRQPCHFHYQGRSSFFIAACRSLIVSELFASCIFFMAVENPQYYIHCTNAVKD